MTTGSVPMITSPMLDALEEFRYCARVYIENPCHGSKYCLDMAAEELRLLGLNPEWVTPDGYEQPGGGS